MTKENVPSFFLTFGKDFDVPFYKSQDDPPKIVINILTLQWMFRTIGCASYQQCTNNKNVIVKPTGPWWSSWPRNRQEQQPLEGSSCSGAELCHSAKLSSGWCNHCGPVHSLRPVPDSHEEWDAGERGMPSRCAHTKFFYSYGCSALTVSWYLPTKKCISSFKKFHLTQINFGIRSASIPFIL